MAPLTVFCGLTVLQVHQDNLAVLCTIGTTAIEDLVLDIPSSYPLV